jgi:LEA14-like dessication related protein
MFRQFQIKINPGSFPKGIFLPLVLGVLAAFVSCACSLSYKNPQVALKKVRVMRITPEAVFLEGTLDLYNPNEPALQFSGYDYSLQVGGRKLVTGESKESFEIGGQKHAVITLPAFIRFEDLSAFFNQDLLGRDIPYRLSGTVQYNTFFGATPIAFSHQGTFNLSEFLREKARELLSRV